MKKKILCAVLIGLLVIGAAVLILLKQTNVIGKSGEASDHAAEAAAFEMEYSDRLCGVPVTNVTSNSSTVEVTYGNAGFARKTLGVVNNSDNRKDLTEETVQTIGSYSVTLKGKGDIYYLATWTYNSYAYTISINDSEEGVTLEEMTDYIVSTW